MPSSILEIVLRRRQNLIPYLFPKLRKALACPTHMTPYELYSLYKLASGKHRIAEIGSYLGASACAFGAAAQGVKPQCKIFCIDTWNNDAMSEGKKDTWSEFKMNTAEYSSSVIPLRGWSNEVCKSLSDLTDTLDLLFVDGDHSYAGAKSDWNLYKSFLKKGSVVVFHDFGWAEGVQKVVYDDVLPLTRDHKSLQNMWWGTIN